MIILRLIAESFRFAWNALRTNVLRTLLSLLGVTIGIFLIIGVFTFVDSLENSVKNSLNFLGTNNINIQKWPYGFEEEGPYPWWKYLRRPQPSFAEFEFLEEKLTKNEAITIFAMRGGMTIKHESSSTNDITLLGVTYGHKDVYEIPIKEGRYFTKQEVQSGRNVAILGYRTAKELFPYGNVIGKEIKVKGMKYYIIATIDEEGESFLGAPTNDDNIYVPYNSFLNLYYSGARRGLESIITVKGKDDDIGLVELEGELRGLMRRKRGIRPKEEDSFALNRPEAIVNFISGVFDAVSLGGWFIGGFSILIGGFGIANIMFVSVRERTNIIGIQKSLGAKNYFILFQFLFESVFLCLLGALIGLFLVFLVTLIPSGTLELEMSLNNGVMGIGVATAIGIISGIIPALMASRMDPVLAIRS